MATVYVQETGAVVRRRGERLAVTRQRETLEEIPLVHVEQLVVVGNVQVTTPALLLLWKNDIDVLFLSSYGKPAGELVRDGSRHAQLRHAQFRRMSDERFLLEVARAIVGGKLTNQRVLLQRQARQGGAATRQGIEGIAQSLAGASRAADHEALRGHEGRAGAWYFGAWRELVPPEFNFQGRAFYPPPDPVNALLSFGYALLDKEVTAAVRLSQLDPYLGFFHTLQYGRPSLVLDMKEEFRPLIVDTVVLAMLHQREIRPQDFEWTGDAQRPVRLTEGARTRLLQRYEERLLTEVQNPHTGDRTTYYQMIQHQVGLLRRVILGEAAAYVPLTWR